MGRKFENRDGRSTGIWRPTQCAPGTNKKGKQGPSPHPCKQGTFPPRSLQFCLAGCKFSTTQLRKSKLEKAGGCWRHFWARVRCAARRQALAVLHLACCPQSSGANEYPILNNTEQREQWELGSQPGYLWTCLFLWRDNLAGAHGPAKFSPPSPSPKSSNPSNCGFS